LLALWATIARAQSPAVIPGATAVDDRLFRRGSLDIYARLLVSHLGNHIPGNRLPRQKHAGRRRAPDVEYSLRSPERRHGHGDEAPVCIRADDGKNGFKSIVRFNGSAAMNREVTLAMACIRPDQDFRGSQEDGPVGSRHGAGADYEIISARDQQLAGRGSRSSRRTADTIEGRSARSGASSTASILVVEARSMAVIGLGAGPRRRSISCSNTGTDLDPRSTHSCRPVRQVVEKLDTESRRRITAGPGGGGRPSWATRRGLPSARPRRCGPHSQRRCAS